MECRGWTFLVSSVSAYPVFAIACTCLRGVIMVPLGLAYHGDDGEPAVSHVAWLIKGGLQPFFNGYVSGHNYYAEMQGYYCEHNYSSFLPPSQALLISYS